MSIISINGTEDGKNGEVIDTYVDWEYPEIYNENKSHIILGLVHTRAADSIRISYDSGRDGWVIEQASTFEWSGDNKICDPDWKEVAFVQAWARENKSYKV